MRNILIALGFLVFGCSDITDHTAEQEALCAHIEGANANQCNAGDSFSPLTCQSAFASFESWWRDDAATEFNTCLTNSACYPQAEGVPGPSIEMPVGVCMDYLIYSGISPTTAETAASVNVCVKLNACAELGSYTIPGCEQIVLNPYADGSLFLLMNDATAAKVEACNTSTCNTYKGCVTDVFLNAGAFNAVRNTRIRMPAVLR